MCKWSFRYSGLTSRTHPFEILLIYLLKSNSLGSIHLNTLVGKKLDNHNHKNYSRLGI